MLDAELERILDRREFLRRHAPPCPYCGTRQVQLKVDSAPATWKCRECPGWFDHEPACDHEPKCTPWQL